MTGQQNRYWKLVVFVSEGWVMGIVGWMQYWNRFKVRGIQGRTGEGDDGCNVCDGHISIISLNRRTPLAFITPFTPSGIRYAHSATPMALAEVMASARSGCPGSSQVSATSTRPSSLIVSTRAGTTFYKAQSISKEGYHQN